MNLILNLILAEHFLIHAVDIATELVSTPGLKISKRLTLIFAHPFVPPLIY